VGNIQSSFFALQKLVGGSRPSLRCPFHLPSWLPHSPTVYTFRLSSKQQHLRPNYLVTLTSSSNIVFRPQHWIYSQHLCRIAHPDLSRPHRGHVDRGHTTNLSVFAFGDNCKMAPSPVHSHVHTNSSASTEKLPNWVVHSDSPTAEIPSIHIQHSLSPPPVPGPNIKYEHNPQPLRDVTNTFYAHRGPPYPSYNPYVTPAPSDASHTWAVKIGNDNSRAQSRAPTPQNPQARVLGSPFEEPQEVVALRAWQLSQTGFVHPHLPTCYARHGSVCTGSVIQTVDVSIPSGPGKRFPPGRYNSVASALAGPLSSSDKTGVYFSTGQVVVKDGEGWKGCSVCFQDEVCAEYSVRKSLPVRARRRHICTNGRSKSFCRMWLSAR
jgi:hypothetical protein